MEGVIYRLQVAGQKLKCPRTVNAKVILRKKKLSFQCHANCDLVSRIKFQCQSGFFTVRCYF